MAKYDVLNGVYRKVAKKYDPVDGVHRNVAEAYAPVNGVYRMYFSSGLKWIKYSTETFHYNVEDPMWSDEETEYTDKTYISAAWWYTGYSFDSQYGRFINEGTLGSVNAGDWMPTETYLYAAGGYQKTVTRYWLSADRKALTSWTKGSTAYIGYTAEEEVGTVYAPEGEYPDAENGYTFRAVYNGYTIMKDPYTNKYYAYLCQEE